MDKNIKIFALLSAFGTLCITIVALYAINQDASWASFAIIIGIIGAIITIAVPVANTIKVRMKQGSKGDSQFDMHIERDMPKTGENTPQSGSHTFSLTEGQSYEFPTKLFGANRYAYTFNIEEIWVMEDATKFSIKVFRHAIKEEPVITVDERQGLFCGENMKIDGDRWQLTLESTEQKTARFRVARL